LSTTSTQTVPTDFTAIDFLDDCRTEIVLDAARPDDKSRIVYAGSGASKRHDGASSSQYSTSWRTVGRHMPSGHTSASVRRPQTAATPISDTGAQPPVAVALPLSGGLTNTHQGTGAAGEGKLRRRAAAMQQLLHCPGLSLPKLSNVVTLRLKIPQIDPRC
jgi:hypothetical protein